MTELSERTLINQLIKKDEEAFKVFVGDYQDLVFNTCLNFLGVNEDAEEITQDVFVETYKSIDSFRGDSTLKTWIYRIAITKSLEFQRKAKRKKRFAFLVSIGSENERMIETQSFNHPGVDADNKERIDILYKHINQLSENQKIAFTLHNMDGLSYKEIAETMDVSVSSVESLIFRAKRNLRKKLSRFYEKN